MATFRFEGNRQIFMNLKILGMDDSGKTTAGRLANSGAFHSMIGVYNSDCSISLLEEEYLETNEKKLPACVSKEFFGDAQFVIVICGLGYFTDISYIDKFLKTALKDNLKTIVLAKPPFSWEGKRRKTVAAKDFKLLEESAALVLELPNHKIMAEAAPDMQMLEAFERFDKIVASFILKLMNIEAENSESPILLEEVQTTFNNHFNSAHL